MRSLYLTGILIFSLAMTMANGVGLAPFGPQQPAQPDDPLPQPAQHGPFQGKKKCYNKGKEANCGCARECYDGTPGKDANCKNYCFEDQCACATKCQS